MRTTALALALLTPALALLAERQTHQDPIGLTEQERKAPRAATVIFLRHAEAQPATRRNRDPLLAQPGEARANRLASVLAHAGITRVFATELQRTQRTAKPIAKRLGLEVETYAARKTKKCVQMLQELKQGEVALVVGHSNTVPAIIKGLGGKLTGLNDRGYLHENEHDRLIVQTLASCDPKQPMRAVQTVDLRTVP